MITIDGMELSENETALLTGIAKSEGITVREALHKAIFLFGMEVDYTCNLAESDKK